MNGRWARRGYLGAVVGALVGLAGCSSDDSDEDDEPEGSTSAHATTAMATATETTTSSTEFELEDASLASQTVTAGESVRVEVTVRNVGADAGELVARLALDDQPVAVTRKRVETGATATLTLSGSVWERGDYATTVNDWRVGDVSVVAREAFHVAPDGDDDGTGSEDAPFATIQTAFDRARAGATIRLAPGRYEQGFETVRAGDSEAPITLTGPPNAVVTGGPGTYDIFAVKHSHVHLTGLTFDGRKDPDTPDDPESYAGGAVHVNPDADEGVIEDVADVLVTDIVVKPAKIGNFRRDAVKVDFATGVEVGEFEVVGPMGLDYLLTENSGYNGEIVYVGRSIGKAVETEGAVLDPTHDVHIHHIDNSAGHEHAEMVDLKPGTSKVLVEYCTDAGGAGSYEESPSVGVKGRDITVRWCRIENVAASGVRVASWHVANPEESPYDVPEEALDQGQANEIYGNVFRSYPIDPIKYMENDDGSIIEAYGPDAQRRVCGNEYDGEARGDPGKACDSDVPAGDGVGHTGGDSPWA